MVVINGTMVVIIGVIWLIIAAITGRKAVAKGMSGFGGFLLGLIIGPLGLAIVLLMPKLAGHS